MHDCPSKSKRKSLRGFWLEEMFFDEHDFGKWKYLLLQLWNKRILAVMTSLLSKTHSPSPKHLFLFTFESLWKLESQQIFTCLKYTNFWAPTTQSMATTAEPAKLMLEWGPRKRDLCRCVNFEVRSMGRDLACFLRYLWLNHIPLMEVIFISFFHSDKGNYFLLS
jgi:hypothetical protein